MTDEVWRSSDRSRSDASSPWSIDDMDQTENNQESNAYVSFPVRPSTKPPADKYKKLIAIVSMTIVILLCIITFILGILRSAEGYQGRLPFLLGLAVLSLLVIQFVIIYLARSGGIKRTNVWFVYVVGLCISAEAILTNIVIFD